MQLVFSAPNKDIYDMLRDGSKRVETRAATVKYQKLHAGDTIIFSCQGEIFSKAISRVRFFPSVGELLKEYKPEDINPMLHSEQEIVKMYYSFPGYREKIEQFGLIAIEFV